MSKRFEMMFLFVSWTDISLGMNIDLKAPRVELHMPFGFLSIGWRNKSENRPVNWRMLNNNYYLIGNPHYERDELWV